MLSFMSEICNTQLKYKIVYKKLARYLAKFLTLFYFKKIRSFCTHTHINAQIHYYFT